MNSSSDRLILITFLCLLSFFFIGCLAVNHIAYSSEEVNPTDTLSPTPTRYIITVNIATNTPEVSTNNDNQDQNQIQVIDFEEITPGVYLLYEEWKAEPSIIGINLETSEEVYFSNNWHAYDNERNRIAYLNNERNLVIQNLHTKDSGEISVDYRCSEKTWSPDGRYIAMNCEDRVYVVSVDDLTLHLLTTWTHPSVHSYWNPTWSPDGKWIATSFRQLSSLNTTEYDDIYLLDASCITDTSTCEERMIGPFLPYSHHVRFAWSPNSDYIAAYSDYAIKVVNINKNTIVTLIDNISDVYGLVWSPDEEMIYYSQETSRYKVDLFKIAFHGGDPFLYAENKGVILSVLDLENH